MQIRNPIYTNDGRIDCQIEHPDFGWIPFTAAADDVEEHGRLIYAAALEMGPAPYVPAEHRVDRTEWRKSARLEKGAFVTELLDAGILSGSEAILASKGDWPQTFADALSMLPVDAVKAQVAWGAATSVARANPLFLALLAHYAKTKKLRPAAAEELGDAIFGWTGPI
jgi:hypothetical protein